MFPKFLAVSIDYRATTLSDGSSDKFLKSLPKRRAMVVLPVPGGPVNTKCDFDNSSAGDTPSFSAAFTVTYQNMDELR